MVMIIGNALLQYNESNTNCENVDNYLKKYSKNVFTKVLY